MSVKKRSMLYTDNSYMEMLPQASDHEWGADEWRGICQHSADIYQPNCRVRALIGLQTTRRSEGV